MPLSIRNKLVLENGLESEPENPSGLFLSLLSFLFFFFSYIFSFFAEQLSCGRKHE